VTPLELQPVLQCYARTAAQPLRFGKTELAEAVCATMWGGASLNHLTRTMRCSVRPHNHAGHAWILSKKHSWGCNRPATHFSTTFANSMPTKRRVSSS